MIFEIDPNPPQDFIGPRLPACRLEDHAWTLMVEDGRPVLSCENPCTEERKRGMDTERHGPMCEVVHEFVDTMYGPEIPVTLRIETEYYPGELGGQGETDAFLVASLAPRERQADD